MSEAHQPAASAHDRRHVGRGTSQVSDEGVGNLGQCQLSHPDRRDMSASLCRVRRHRAFRAYTGKQCSLIRELPAGCAEVLVLRGSAHCHWQAGNLATFRSSCWRGLSRPQI
jgi:hypothetical protein